MLSGVHVLVYSADPEADRAFFRDVLEFPAVDSGDGWLIFSLPPAEAAFHPPQGETTHRHAGGDLAGAVLYLMCDDLERTMSVLGAKGVEWGPVGDEPWGRRTTFRLPSGGEIGLYQPTHPTAIRRTTFS